MENTECYDNIAVYVVEVPVADHKKVEVIEAKGERIGESDEVRSLRRS